ncbi:Hypothetical protein PP7435_CHR1-0351 [Komagataella phaffii CBS 7435]|uniref:Uncharacterized protein n=2 Tax=Komagataella phaffii TaxID=460519 RepID=C4QVY7_KOMPG|nr:Hypothetical protein PAS_chr1-1_0052 [Komagataella phaffii GS115]AOA60523.1 GQ67_02614T0 [Komagataella phaffii]CAH2446073.1 Hypothetical protein BQ9382_C1-1815 [Komagataella phaffii CBS 7435]AOA66842.1 GQ68_02634T0 [Komagataella phaffii GS115]CAY67410.1 Hypothetical protein PAS_chr1-1_0052 [Komagataella phaffii GS115]CCA36510.1 Hypothetical protein PP7435_CHR1-0351 [Komagataella phaffii CBS 7435]
MLFKDKIQPKGDFDEIPGYYPGKAVNGHRKLFKRDHMGRMGILPSLFLGLISLFFDIQTLETLILVIWLLGLWMPFFVHMLIILTLQHYSMVVKEILFFPVLLFTFLYNRMAKRLNRRIYFKRKEIASEYHMNDPDLARFVELDFYEELDSQVLKELFWNNQMIGVSSDFRRLKYPHELKRTSLEVKKMCSEDIPLKNSSELNIKAKRKSKRRESEKENLGANDPRYKIRIANDVTPKRSSSPLRIRRNLSTLINRENLTSNEVNSDSSVESIDSTISVLGTSSPTRSKSFNWRKVTDHVPTPGRTPGRWKTYSGSPRKRDLFQNSVKGSSKFPSKQQEINSYKKLLTNGVRLTTGTAGAKIGSEASSILKQSASSLVNGGTEMVAGLGSHAVKLTASSVSSLVKP